MNYSITISNDSLQEYGNTLMLRGFSEFISWKHIKNSSDYHHKCIIQDLVKVIKKNNFQTIIWDGDLYKSDSFTHLIYELMNSLPQGTEFVAYKPKDTSEKFCDGDIKNCEVGWCQLKTNKRIYILLNEVQLPVGMKWFEKNDLLTKYIYTDVSNRSSKLSVFYIGGGKLITNEMENLNNYIPYSERSNVKVRFIDIPRASFSIDDDGIPVSKIQYLGNSCKSVDPIDILPNEFYKSSENSNINLKFSKVKYLIEYKYDLNCNKENA